MDVSSIRSRGQALRQGLQQQELPEEASERSLRRREEDELRGAAGGHGRLRRVLALGVWAEGVSGVVARFICIV